MAQKCSYSRFENNSPVLEDPEKRTSDLNSIPSSPRKIQEPESQSGITTTNNSDHLESAITDHSGDAGHPPEEPSHPKNDLQTLAAPALPERTKSLDTSAAMQTQPFCKSDSCAACLSLQQNWCNLARSPQQMKPRWTVASGPYEGKRISQMYLFRNTRPW